MNIPFVVFDIETKPRPDLVEKFGDKYPEFDEASVKYGNARDPQKRLEIFAQKQADHEAGREAFMAAQREKAALNPFTAEVMCIGLRDEKRTVIVDCAEFYALEQFWSDFSHREFAHHKFCFYSGSGDPAKKFDLDFIITRSRILKVPIPMDAIKGRFYNERFVDLAEVFLLSQRDRYLSLSKCAEILGIFDQHKDVTPKSDADIVTGANFHTFWNGSAGSRQLAEKYLFNDLAITAHIAERLL